MYPKFDREFILQTDASDYGVAVVLSQSDNNGIESVVTCASKSLSNRKRNFSTTEKKAFANYFGAQHFRVYLLVRLFRIITDHDAIMVAQYGAKRSDLRVGLRICRNSNFFFPCKIDQAESITMQMDSPGQSQSSPIQLLPPQLL